MDHLPAGALSLNRLTWGAQVQVDPGRLDDYCLISVPVSGAARFHLDGDAVDVSPRRACVIGAAQRFYFEADARFDQIVVRFEHQALADAWTALTASAPPVEIHLRPELPLDGAAWRALEPWLNAAAACVRGGYAPTLLPHLHHRLQDMLLTTLLLHCAPSLMAGPPATAPSATAALVRRAQSSMRARLAEPMSLGDVARTHGVAARTLQAAFQRECGVGPMQWLRQQRLNAVHRVLCEADASTTRVTDLALGFGFTHLGEFSRAYRHKFGETPSRTLARR
jgi:AraC-like DNA-binding protein